MSLFNKKSPEERKAELERERQELEQRKKEAAERKGKVYKPKANIKNNSNSNANDLNNSLNNDNDINVSSQGLKRVNVKKIQTNVTNKNNESEAQFIKRISSHKVNELSEKQIQKEVISRLQKSDYAKIIDYINSSKDLYDFYERVTKDFKPEVLVSLRIISKAEEAVFRYIKENNLSNELYQGDIELLNKAYIENQQEGYKIFADEHQKLLTSIKSGKTQDREIRINNMPIIYILGSSDEFNFVNAMSLPTKVLPILTEDDLDIFANDDRNKCVILMKHPDPSLGNEFKKIKEKQSFRTFLSFKLSSMNNKDEIVPFNRDNILNKFL